MTRLPRRGVPAALAALVLLVACVLTATEAVQLLARKQPLIRYHSIADTAHRAHWNGLGLGIAGGVAIVLGIALLVAAFLPGKPIVVPLREDGANDSGASVRSMRSTLRSAAGSVDGVSSAKLKLRRHKIAARVRADRADDADRDLTGDVKAAIEHRLDQISPVTRPTLRLKVKTTRSKS